MKKTIKEFTISRRPHGALTAFYGHSLDGHFERDH